LQGRRFSSPEAKVAIEESVRRIRAIALVHETLSREAGDDVAFVEIVRPLARMVEEGMSSEDRPVKFTVEGDAGVLPATVATPLSVVLNELLQNAIDHAFPPTLDLQAEPGSVVVSLRNDGVRLQATVVDDGVGLPEGFSLDAVTGLGLSIVRTLVTSELVGTISLERGAAGGDRPGTIVRLDVPVVAPP
jgi:two-component sensor histidine kinase